MCATAIGGWVNTVKCQHMYCQDTPRTRSNDSEINQLVHDVDPRSFGEIQYDLFASESFPSKA